MKTTYRRNSSGPLARRLSAIALVIAIGLALYYLGKPIMASFSSPILKTKTQLGNSAGLLLGKFQNQSDLLKEMNALREKANAYDSLQESYAALASSSADLLRSFGRMPTTTEIAASVIMHPPETPYDLILIDAGQSEGIKQGDLVALPEGGLLGVVEEVFDHTSRVSLYTSSGRETKAYLSGSDTAFILKGAGGGTFEVSIPRDLPIQIGDFFFAPGINSEYLGRVNKIDVNPTDALKKVLVGGVANVSSLRFVVVKPNLQ